MKRIQKGFLIFLVLLMATAVFASISVSSAHDPPWTLDTYAYLNLSPDPIGVNQPVFVSMWIDKVPPGSTGPWGPRWHGFMVDITKPDGSKESLGPYDSDSVGGAWLQYTPDQLGTYKFVFNFPGQTVENENPTPYGGQTGAAFIGDYYKPSTSKETTLTVQQEKIDAQYGAAPQPTEYWSRPINSMNREWSAIAGNWFGLKSTSFGNTGMYSNAGNFMPYSTAPNSAHVVWTKPIAFGGQIGGEFGSEDLELFATGTAYEAKFGAVIINGVLYYTEIPGAATNRGELKAVDMRTGEELWSNPMRSEYHTLRAGMVYNFITGDQYGGHAYLFTSNIDQLGFFTNTIEPPKWSMYEAMTGEWILDIANVSAGTLSIGPNGELLSYAAAAGKLTLWNSSKCIEAGSWNQTFRIYTPLEIWRPPQGATIDWNGGIEWSVPLAGPGAINCIADGVLVTENSLGGAFGVPGGSQTGWQLETGYDAATGEVLWGPVNRTLTPWTAIVTRGIAGDGIYIHYNRNTLEITAFDLQTGEKLWTAEPEDNDWGYYDYAHGIVIGYGKAYSFGMGGSVYCYDIADGKRLWKWTPENPGLDTPYGVWPLGTWGDHHILADGKLYVRSGHDYTPPVYKGAKLYCLDADTGDEIWSSLSFDIIGSPALHDGYMLWLNGYDNQIYCYGKGPSATTLSIQDDNIAKGESVTIKGAITDESMGAKKYAQAARFPNGVPAIADESMSAWMEYLYQQQPKLTNAKGVTVKLTATDDSGNSFDIGTATSDTNGKYGIAWTPLAEGTYHIKATFEGTNSYWGSEDTAYLIVGSSSETNTNTGTAAVGTDPTVIIGIAVVALIVAVVAVVFAIRKRQ